MQSSRDHRLMVARVRAVLQPVILACVLSDSQHHFKHICMPGAAYGEMPRIFTIVLSSFPFPTLPQRASFHTNPIFLQVTPKKTLF